MFPGIVFGAMVRHLTLSQHADAYATPPPTDDRNPATLVTAAVAEVLGIAETWLGWDGRPVCHDGNAWTPHKAVRRVADHLPDHLAEIECRLAGQPTVPDQWHGRMATTDADFTRFTEIDLDEATSRLDARTDANGWTLREVVHHGSQVTYYARALGTLGPAKA